MAAKLNGATVQIVMYHDEVPVDVHWFNLPKYNQPEFYRSTSSFSWFVNREHTRYANYLDRKRAAKTKVRPLGWRASCKYFGQQGTAMFNLEMKYKLFDELPQHQHDSIWKFYEAIGYDRTNKRHTREAPV